MVPISRWWLNQPNWKIYQSNWIISPGIGVKIKRSYSTNPWVPGSRVHSCEPCWFEVSPGHRPLSPNLKAGAFWDWQGATWFVTPLPHTHILQFFGLKYLGVYPSYCKKIIRINAFGWKLVKKCPGHPAEWDTWVLLFPVALFLAEEKSQSSFDAPNLSSNKLPTEAWNIPQVNQNT